MCCSTRFQPCSTTLFGGRFCLAFPGQCRSSEAHEPSLCTCVEHVGLWSRLALGRLDDRRGEQGLRARPHRGIAPKANQLQKGPLWSLKDKGATAACVCGCGSKRPNCEKSNSNETLKFLSAITKKKQKPHEFCTDPRLALLPLLLPHLFALLGTPGAPAPRVPVVEADALLPVPGTSTSRGG